MRFAIRHDTDYRYANPVRLGPHVLRLVPQGPGIAALTQEFEIRPAPTRRTKRRDAFGNAVLEVDFAGETDHLRIASRFTLETTDELGATTAPPEVLAPYLGVRGAAPDPGVAGFVREALDDPSGGEVPALLAAAIHARLRRRIRDTGVAMTPAETLAAGTGACRDLATLFIACCRFNGIPARFVSGYQARSALATPERYLHGWAEAWVPGRGWRAYDPTHGIAVGTTHVALARAPGQSGTMPVEGGYWGDGGDTRLDFAVTIETAP